MMPRKTPPSPPMRLSHVRTWSAVIGPSKATGFGSLTTSVMTPEIASASLMFACRYVGSTCTFVSVIAASSTGHCRLLLAHRSLAASHRFGISARWTYISHHIDEALEQVHVVERSRRRLGVVLDRHHRFTPVAQAFHRAVVDVSMAHLYVGAEACFVDRVAVVLRRHVHAPARFFPDRVVGATVTELQLEGLRAEHFGEHLVAKANPHERRLSHERRRASDRVVEQRRIAGPRRDQHA